MKRVFELYRDFLQPAGSAALFFYALFIANTASAQAPPATDQFGAADHITETVAAFDCLPGSNTTAYNLLGSGGNVNITAGIGFFSCQLDLPSGARVTGFELEACDDSTTAQLEAGINAAPTPGAGLTQIFSVSTGTAATPGCGLFGGLANLGAPFTIDNLDNTYIVNIFDEELEVVGTTTSFRAVRVYWRRQIRPPGVPATFDDVPTTHQFYRSVEALADSGITGGCGGNNYCPDDPITRAEMAAFMARALGLYWPF